MRHTAIHALLCSSLLLNTLLIGITLGGGAGAQSNSLWELTTDTDTKKVWEKAVSEPTATSEPAPTATEAPTATPTVEPPGEVEQINAFPLGVFDRANLISEALVDDLQAHELDSYLANHGMTTSAVDALAVTDDEAFSVYWRNTQEGKAWFDLPEGEQTIEKAREIWYPIIDAMNEGTHPSLKGYIVEDEPHKDAASINEVQLAHQAIRERTSLPYFSILIGNRIVDLYDPAVDPILFFDLYGVRSQNEPCEMSIPSGVDIADQLRNMYQIKPDTAPMWVLLQAHNFDAAVDSNDLRQPSAAEIRLQQWLAMSEGATGIFWFKYDSVNGMAGLVDSPEQYAEVADMAARTRTFDDILLGAYKDHDEFTMSGQVEGIEPHASTLRARDGSAEYVVAVNRSCSDQNLSLSTEGRAVGLLDVETGETFAEGGTIFFRAGDGRLLEVVPESGDPTPTPTPTETATATPEATATPTPEPEPTPTATSDPGATSHGVPVVPLDLSLSVDDWWAEHPMNPAAPDGIPIGGIGPPEGADTVTLNPGDSIQATILSAPAAGRVIQLPAGVYVNNIDIVDQDHIHIVGIEPGVVISGGTVTSESANNQSSQISACAEMKDLPSFAQAINAWESNGSNQWARDCYGDPVEDIYFRDLTFDGANSANTLFMMRGVSGLAFDNVTVTNFVNPQIGKLVANLHHNVLAENVWYRGMTFSGEGDHAVNMDGMQGGGVIQSTVTGGYNRIFGVFTNNDFTLDLNDNDTLEDEELRIGRYVVFEDVQIDDGGVWAIHGSGADLLIRRVEATNSYREFILGEARNCSGNLCETNRYEYTGWLVEDNTVNVTNQHAFNLAGPGYDGGFTIRDNSFGSVGGDFIFSEHGLDEPVSQCGNTVGGSPVDGAC